MPILPIFEILIFSNTYKFNHILDRPNVTNVVKNIVKKLSVGQKITDGFGWCINKVQGSGVQLSGKGRCQCSGVRCQ